ncbi:UDP-glucose--hexose-1-phosphate uridylyltransferase [uncultured Sphaerochaeta sp.]|uniref:UDP-glucose--hexose-1-phosphate uridylyltransferase n=1 Tax=uncultured Sphaerochaeta sp. TaxID=886478 RepID=UPI002A0A2B7D|nr:UDP-glucose--hexose-1-phosphate uridylyltransferase [uncultured Sphaerochaeta sp.]
MNIQSDTHNRFNPLLGEWIKVSPHRTKRPWNGQVEKQPAQSRPSYDSSCYLCPGNTRSTGEKNPLYTDTFVFNNDFSSLLYDTENGILEEGPHGLLQAKTEKGICKVLCFSPRHDLTLARMSVEGIEKVILSWIEQYEELGSKPFINYVQIFENRGAIMGCSNPHPHSQIWAEEIIPDIPVKELENQATYFETYHSSLLLDYARYEAEKEERLITSNEDFIAVVPFWAVWPYEALILPLRREIESLDELSPTERTNLASIMKDLGIRYDNLFETSFPYSMGIHQKPTDGKTYPGNILHIHYFPPLLRSATVKKFMVGYEMMAMPQRDITAEGAAKTLKSLSSIHYTEKK